MNSKVQIEWQESPWRDRKTLGHNIKFGYNIIRQSKPQACKSEWRSPHDISSKTRNRNLGVGSPSVNLLVGMGSNKPDSALSHQLLDSFPCQRSSDLHTECTSPKTIHERSNKRFKHKWNWGGLSRWGHCTQQKQSYPWIWNWLNRSRLAKTLTLDLKSIIQQECSQLHP